MNVDVRDRKSVEEALAKLVVRAQVERATELEMLSAKSEEDISILNATLTMSNQQLSAANADLESFSYSVAHDLRSPIRQIVGFSKILFEEYGPQLPSDAQRYLHKVEQGAQQMGALIDDLLHLAQVGRQALLVQPNSLNSIVAAAIESLQPNYPGRTIEWRIATLCTVDCDWSLMKQVFVNLFDNALKYTQLRDTAVVEVGQMNLNNELVIFVRDNGVGFDMRYVGKLFKAFQRLHSASEYEGTGIGLATAERIIRKHGGRIWVHAELDQGATFFFTIPPCAP